MKNQIVKLVNVALGLALLVSSAMPASATLTDGSASLAFQPNTKAATLNANFDIDVVVSTGTDATIGTDAVVKYDSSKLEYVPIASTDAAYNASDYNLVIRVHRPERQEVVISGLVSPGSTTYVSGSNKKVGTLRFKPKAVGTTTLSFTFDTANPDKTDDSNVVYKDTTKTDLLQTVGTATITVTEGGNGGTVTPPPSTTPVAGDPIIYYIYPNTGNKNMPTDVTIIGANFGTYVADSSKVFIGLVPAVVKDWSPNRIVIQVPPAPEVINRSTLSVKVYRSDGKMAEYLGFTYISAPLPGTGPEVWIWASIIAAALALAGVTYRKFALAGSHQVSSDIDHLTPIQ